MSLHGLNASQYHNYVFLLLNLLRLLKPTSLVSPFHSRIYKKKAIKTHVDISVGCTIMTQTSKGNFKDFIFTEK